VGKYYPQSKVEVGGLLARHYDRLMDVMAFGRYRLFIERVVRLMNIKPADRIIDFATGTGRNACLMMKYLSRRGRLVALDISEGGCVNTCGNSPRASSRDLIYAASWLA